MSDSEQMTANSRSALAKIKAVLELEIDPENARLTGIITNAALMTLSQKIKIDEHSLSQHQERHDLERQIRVRELLADYEQYCARREGNKPGVPEGSVASEGSGM